MTQPPPEQPGYGEQPPGQQPPAGQPYGSQPYGSQPYGSQPYGGQPGHDSYAGHGGPPPSRSKGMAIAALVCGALALLFCWTIVGGILLGLIAIVLGIIAAGRAKNGRAGGRGMAITGAVLGLLGLVLAGVIIAIGASFLNSPTGQNLRECLESAGNDQSAIDECEREFREDVEQSG